MTIPAVILNTINGCEAPAESGDVLSKRNPHDGSEICTFARSRTGDVEAAIAASCAAQPGWADLTPVRRGDILRDVALALRDRQEEVAAIVALETGKCPRDALGETGGAVELGMFMAGEGRRLYGRTTTSAVPNKSAMTIRGPVGVAGLIIAANTPIANVAWKVFPALICGNTAVLKAAEDTPATAWAFSRIAADAGLPPGVLNVVHGLGPEAGGPLVAHPAVDLISFTGSTEVGRRIAALAGQRLARVSLELGGKNPLVVCDDADMEKAVEWTLLSAFSNAGQRCAAASRIIIFDAIYDAFCERLIERTRKLTLGPTDQNDLGPVINLKQLERMVAVVSRANDNGATILTGGSRLLDSEHRDGFYMAPTLIEKAGPRSEISTHELFGPVACLYRVKGFRQALAMANDSPYGLTACIHTASLHRAQVFTQKVEAGAVVVNAGTYGSEPHMPFGGPKHSGNGWREPGTEALDVYSELKDVYINVDPKAL